MTGAGLYIPDNPALLDLISRPTKGFRPDHAAYFLYSICVKKWMGDLDVDGYARLDSRILKHWIQSRALTATKRCLTEAGVIATTGHSAGRFSTGYRISDAFDGPPRRWLVEHEPLAKKLLAYRGRYRGGDDPETESVVRRRGPLLDQQRNALASLSLPDTPDGLALALRDQADPDHVKYICHCIEHHDHDGLSVDHKGWRIHSIITRTSRHLRPRLLLAGLPVAEVDVGCSQPLLLAILLAQPIDKALCVPKGEEGERREAARDTSTMWSKSFICGVTALYVEHAGELASYRVACETGELYDLLANDVGITREQAKKGLFSQVLFCKPCVNGTLTKAFGLRWPTILAWVREAKRNDYKALAWALQRLESRIMLDCIGNSLLRELPGLRFLTIHDSALLVADEAQAVKAIMQDEFSRWGAMPTIRVKAAGV